MMSSKEDDSIEEELAMAKEEVKDDISMADVKAKVKEGMFKKKEDEEPDVGAGNKETTGATKSQGVDVETANASMYESFSEIVDLPAPLPSRANSRTSTPGAHATAGTPSCRRPREGTPTPVTEEVQLPETQEEGTAIVEAEIAPDMEDLEAENTALKEQLQRIQESEQDIVLAEPVSTNMDKKRRALVIGSSFLFVLVLLVVVIILALLLPKNENENKHGDSVVVEVQERTPPPIPDYKLNTTRIQILQNLFEHLYGDIINQDQHAKSLRALHWLANEDPAVLNLTATPFYALHERYILALFYFSTDGWNWNNQVNWLSAFSICRWENVNCDPKELKRVRELALSKNNLHGTIPREIGNLEILDRCDLGKEYGSGIANLNCIHWELALIIFFQSLHTF
jgi:hypothetical protein